MHAMSRELKANLVFIIALLIVAAPGVFIMMRKRMEQSSHGNGGDFMRSVVPSSVAFNQPPPYRPNLPKYEPPVARAWVETEIRKTLPADARVIRARDGTPIMSDNSRLQLLSINTRTAHLLLWDNPAQLPQLTPTPTSVEMKKLIVPKDVRHALQNVGYVNPPEEIRELTCTFPTDASPLHVKAEYTDAANQKIVETLDYEP